MEQLPRQADLPPEDSPPGGHHAGEADEAALRAWVEQQQRDVRLLAVFEAMARSVDEGIEQAQTEHRSIDDATAGRIAWMFDPGEGALHALAEIGLIRDDIDDELDRKLEEFSAIESWIDVLRAYCAGRTDKGEQPGWHVPGSEDAARQRNEGAQSEAREIGERPEPDVEFGQLSREPVQGVSWDEFVITRGIAEAERDERDERSIDHRTAHYIAGLLAQITTPALRMLAATGAIHKTRLEEEIVSILHDRTAEEQRWIGWLANYYQNRQDHGPVAHWRQDIADQDRAENELLRRERLLEDMDDLFAASADEELAGVEELGWFGLLHHDRTPGGWMLHHQAQDDSRDVFETDSEAELNEHWRDLKERYLEMYWRNRPIIATPGDADGKADDGAADRSHPEP